MAATAPWPWQSAVQRDILQVALNTTINVRAIDPRLSVISQQVHIELQKQKEYTTELLTSSIHRDSRRVILILIINKCAAAAPSIVLSRVSTYLVAL